MKSQILLLALAVSALSSCTTSYKTGQTPDDVYYSPVRPQDEYVQSTKKDDSRYESREQYYDDRYLRMRVTNPQLWSELDDYYYFGNRYDYSYYTSLYWYNPWSPCTYWNYYYNPYYHGSVIVSPSSPVFNHPRTVNLNTYNNNMLTNNHYSNPTHPGFSIVGASSVGTSGSGYNYSNTNSNNSSRSSGAGNLLRSIFNTGSSGSSSSGSHPGTTSGSSGGGGGSHSSGGSAPVRRF